MVRHRSQNSSLLGPPVTHIFMIEAVLESILNIPEAQPSSKNNLAATTPLVEPTKDPHLRSLNFIGAAFPANLRPLAPPNALSMTSRWPRCCKKAATLLSVCTQESNHSIAVVQVCLIEFSIMWFQPDIRRAKGKVFSPPWPIMPKKESTTSCEFAKEDSVPMSVGTPRMDPHQCRMLSREGPYSSQTAWSTAIILSGAHMCLWARDTVGSLRRNTVGGLFTPTNVNTFSRDARTSRPNAREASTNNSRTVCACCPCFSRTIDLANKMRDTNIKEQSRRILDSRTASLPGHWNPEAEAAIRKLSASEDPTAAVNESCQVSCCRATSLRLPDASAHSMRNEDSIFFLTWPRRNVCRDFTERSACGSRETGSDRASDNCKEPEVCMAGRSAPQKPWRRCLARSTRLGRRKLSCRRENCDLDNFASGQVPSIPLTTARRSKGQAPLRSNGAMVLWVSHRKTLEQPHKTI